MHKLLSETLHNILLRTCEIIGKVVLEAELIHRGGEQSRN